MLVDTYTPRGGTPNAPIVLMAKAYDPIWSGTGHFFAFRGSRGGPEYYPMSLYIYRVRQDRNGGPGKPELWQKIDYDLDYYAWSPSPSENRLLFDALEGPREKRSPRALFMYEAGRRHLRIVDHAPWLQDPTTREWVPPYIPGYSWSPDGKYLVYPLVTEAMGDGQPLDADLWIASADGARRQQLTFTPKVLEAWPKWVLKDRIDALRIIFSTEPPKTEKVRLRLTTPRGVLLLDRETATLGDAIQPLSEPVPPKVPAQPVLARAIPMRA